MPRRLSDDVNTLLVRDNLSQCDIELSYRMPTTKDRVAYANDCIQRKKGKVVNRTTEARLKHGLKILAGIREGDFEVKDDAGQWVPLASEPRSDHFQADWKAQIKKQAADLVELLAIQVFDMPAQTIRQDDEDVDEEGEDPEKS